MFLILVSLLGQIQAPEGITLTGAYAYIQTACGATSCAQSVGMLDSVPADSLGPSFWMQTRNHRTAGELFRLYNADELVLHIDSAGNLVLDSGGHIIVNGHSGQNALTAMSGGYLYITGSLPSNYWGHHGALTVGNENKMIAGYLLQAWNPSPRNDYTGYKFQINYQGGWETQAEIRSYELAICDGQDVHCDSDDSNRYDGSIIPGTTLPNGHIACNWTTATDAGHAFAGNIMPWVVDVEEACQCVPRLFDGGVASGWRRMSTRAECVP